MSLVRFRRNRTGLRGYVHIYIYGEGKEKKCYCYIK